MGDIKVQVQWAARGGNASLYLLDGMRARNDRNAWSFETNAMEQFALDNVTLVMPWAAKPASIRTGTTPAISMLSRSPTNGRRSYSRTARLSANFGVDRTNTGVVGLSMGGTAAMTLAAYHREPVPIRRLAVGLSEYDGRGMREAIRIAMYDAGRYNADSMWGFRGIRRGCATIRSSRRRNCRACRVRVRRQRGYGRVRPAHRLVGYWNTTMAMGLEFLSMVTTRAFECFVCTPGDSRELPVPWHRHPCVAVLVGRAVQARPQILNALNAW
ncbi:esterase family protein [Rhodococcus hoagii]|nr:esterase family protein [Prescottella equi]NKZ87755.1 esterase family protein [Prescottella equi]